MEWDFEREADSASFASSMQTNPATFGCSPEVAPVSSYADSASLLMKSDHPSILHSELPSSLSSVLSEEADLNKGVLARSQQSSSC